MIHDFMNLQPAKTTKFRSILYGELNVMIIINMMNFINLYLDI